MALNDETERLDLAEEYLLKYPGSSQEFEAALEHVQWVHRTKPRHALRCEQIIRTVARFAEKNGETAKLRLLGITR